MKITVKILTLVAVISLLNCNKEDEVKTALPRDITTIVLNDTIGSPGTTGWIHSVGLDFDSINPSEDQHDLDYFLGSYHNANDPTEDDYILFVANDYHQLIYSNDDNKLTKFESGDIINGSEEGGSFGNRGNDIYVINKDEATNFSLNSTAYIGISYSGNYNGWVKIKILNNYHHFVIVSYSVCKTPNLRVRINN